MSKPEWGTKRICPSCNIKYYDFDKSPIICPSCKFQFDPDLLLKSRKGRGFSNKVEESVSTENASDLNNDKNVDANEDLDVIDNDTEILEMEEVEPIESDLDEEEEGKVLDSDLDEDLNDEIQTDEDLSFDDEDLGVEENDISVEIEDEEDKN